MKITFFEKHRKVLVKAGAGAAFLMGWLLFLGCFIGTSAIIPENAIIFLDDATKTYFGCSGEPSAPLRRSTVSEAYRLHYKAGQNCQPPVRFVDEDWPLTGLLLVRVGILSPAKHWWDSPR